jgi:hypothetical protein
MSFLSGLFSLGNSVLLTVVFSLGMTAGTWVGHKFFAKETPPDFEEVMYQLPKGEIVRDHAIEYNGTLYYPSDFVNGWLRDKLKSKGRLNG